MPMEKTIQAKHVPEAVIFTRLLHAPGWMYTFEIAEWMDSDALARNFYSSPELRGVPWKVLQAKLKALRRRGLIDGCACGCRGDWELTTEGVAYAKRKGYPVQIEDIVTVEDISMASAKKALKDLREDYLALEKQTDMLSLCLKHLLDREGRVRLTLEDMKAADLLPAIEVTMDEALGVASYQLARDPSKGSLLDAVRPVLNVIVDNEK